MLQKCQVVDLCEHGCQPCWVLCPAWVILLCIPAQFPLIPYNDYCKPSPFHANFWFYPFSYSQQVTSSPTKQKTDTNLSSFCSPYISPHAARPPFLPSPQSRWNRYPFSWEWWVHLRTESSLFLASEETYSIHYPPKLCFHLISTCSFPSAFKYVHVSPLTKHPF